MGSASREHPRPRVCTGSDNNIWTPWSCVKSTFEGASGTEPDLDSCMCSEKWKLWIPRHDQKIRKMPWCFVSEKPRYGLNEVPEEKEPLWKMFLKQFTGPMQIMIECAALLPGSLWSVTVWSFLKGSPPPTPMELCFAFEVVLYDSQLAWLHHYHGVCDASGGRYGYDILLFLGSVLLTYLAFRMNRVPIDHCFCYLGTTDCSYILCRFN